MKNTNFGTTINMEGSFSGLLEDGPINLWTFEKVKDLAQKARCNLSDEQINAVLKKTKPSDFEPDLIYYIVEVLSLP